MKKGILSTLALVYLSVQTWAQSNMQWADVSNEGESFKETAIEVGQYVSVGILGIAMIWMIYALTSDSPKKKESVITFIIAVVLNTIMWAMIGA